MQKDKSETVKVVVRCRPLSKKELEDGRQHAMTADPKARSIIGVNPENNEKKEFTFDFTYSPESTQEQIFNETALPILSSVIQGYNGTIFAYGQTGTGKTHTMDGGKGDERGIIPRAIDWIFQAIKKTKDQEFLVQVSFVEIYNEEVRDLLSKNTNAKLKVRDKDGIFYVEDCKKIRVELPEEMLKIMNKGKENRKTGATLMNPDSSRSHSIFQIVIESSEIVDGKPKYKMGKLNLVDLAGSERQDKTGATGERLKEATKINQSLSTLGNVISALVIGKSDFVPYRESRLTMLLADSLGGNTKTVMIANIGPADYNYDESIRTLWYAARAKKIKNQPKINEDPKDALLRGIQEEIELMKKQLAQMGKGGVPMKTVTDNNGKIVLVEDESAIKKMEESLALEKENFKKQKEDEIKQIQNQKNLADEEKKKLYEKIELEKEEFNKNKEEADRLRKKIKDMDSKVLKSNENKKKVKQQEEEIIRTKEELRSIQMEEERLKRNLEETKKANLEIDIQYKNIQSELDDINAKIQLARDTIDNINADLKTNQYLEEIISIEDSNRLLLQENTKKEFLIKYFIPETEKKKIIDCIEFNEKEGIYMINKKKAVKNNFVSNKDIINKMKNNQLSRDDDDYLKFEKEKSEAEMLVNLTLEMPDKFVSEYTGETNSQYCSEIEHILKDDDSDLLYYDRELNLFDSTVIPFADTGIKKRNITEDKGVSKPRIATAKKKVN